MPVRKRIGNGPWLITWGSGSNGAESAFQRDGSIQLTDMTGLMQKTYVLCRSLMPSEKLTLCVLSTCINPCIYLWPENHDRSGAETHFRFLCYRTPNNAT